MISKYEGLEKLIHPSQVLPAVQANKKVAAGRSRSGKRCLLQERDTIEKDNDAERMVCRSDHLGFAVVIIFLHPRESSSETGAKVPGGDYKYVIDLSHHNPGRIVWDSLSVMTDKHGHTTKSINKAERIIPVSYVILKASEGISLKDKNFKRIGRLQERLVWDVELIIFQDFQES